MMSWQQAVKSRRSDLIQISANILAFWLLFWWFAHPYLALGGVQLPLPVLQWSEWTERT